MSSSNLAITTSTGAITAAQNIDAGYEETVCIECLNQGGSSITHTIWKVTQDPNCSTLTPVGSLDPIVFAFDSTATTPTTTVYTRTEMFGNIRANVCSITGCVLKKTDCTSNLDEPYLSALSIGSPYDLKIKNNQESGLASIDVCVECSTSAHTETN
jgi:hypothetical protein